MKRSVHCLAIPLLKNKHCMPDSSTEGASIAEALRATFERWRGDAEGVAVVRAPGRVNLIGEHTDYNDGFVLPMTLGRAIYVALRARSDDRIRLRSLNFDEEAALRVGKPPETPPAHWATYVGGVLCELHRRGAFETGMEMLLFGDVPVGAGLSSSAALEVAVAVAVEVLTGSPRDPVETAKLCQYVEHTYAGVQCGIMDQFAARLGRAGHALFLDCRTLAYRPVPLPLDQAALVIVDSGVRRQLAASKYNERHAECAQAVAHFQQIDPSIQALRDVSPALFVQHKASLPEVIQKRAQHVVEENARVEEAVRLLEAGDLAGFGACMNQSHESLRDLYEVSCPEIDFLVETAQQTPGVLGARITGGGFGGCTVNLVEKLAAEAVCEVILDRYERQFDHEARVYLLEENVEAGPMPS